MNVELYTAIPKLVQSDRIQFVNELKRIAKQSEKYNFKGVLVYSDNSLADPWLVTSLILSETEKLVPMIALQPVYMHPYTVAKKIASIALIHGRRIALNLVAGGFVNDLKALNDSTGHDRRYDRLREYTQIIQKLLTSRSPVTYEGEFYQIKNLKLKPEIPESLLPLYYLSGSSGAARETAAVLGAQLIQYPEPVEEFSRDHIPGDNTAKGIRIGILARPSHNEAWSDAVQRFPETRIGEFAHQLAKNTSDSEWHNRLSAHGEKNSRKINVNENTLENGSKTDSVENAGKTNGSSRTAATANGNFEEETAAESDTARAKIANGNGKQVENNKKTDSSPEEPVYWLGPFKHYHTFCPYLVGDYREVAEELAAYLSAGCTTCILDTPVSETELEHTMQAFNRADTQTEHAL